MRRFLRRGTSEQKRASKSLLVNPAKSRGEFFEQINPETGEIQRFQQDFKNENFSNILWITRWNLSLLLSWSTSDNNRIQDSEKHTVEYNFLNDNNVRNCINTILDNLVTIDKGWYAKCTPALFWSITFLKPSSANCSFIGEPNHYYILSSLCNGSKQGFEENQTLVSR